MYSEKFYGDEWLSLRDTFNNMTRDEMIIFTMQQQIPYPLPEFELVYLSGAKKMMNYQARYLHLMNEVIKKNPALRERYIKEGKLIDFEKMQQDSKKAMLEAIKNQNKKPAGTMFQ